MDSVDESTSTRPQQKGDAGAAAFANQEFRKMIMNSDRNSLNLAAVRGRADELRKSLDQVIFALQQNFVHWHETLDKFAVMNVQYQNLIEQLRPLLKLYVVHPKSVNQQNAAIVPIMLATKVLPEMETEEAALLADLNKATKGKSLDSQYEQLQSAEESFNTLIKFVTVMTSEGTGVLDSKSAIRRELAAAMKTQLGTVPEAGKASRKRKLDPPDALLLSVVSGEGLRTGK